MSWITDVLLIFSLEEYLNKYDEEIEEVLPLLNVNRWLQENNFLLLDRLDNHVTLGMQACVYGGSFNYFNSNGLIETIQKQQWQNPKAVILLIQE
ncbi:hypothetical protein PN466_10420 [Roseofilum reptotaenium CS-1145]|uniref:Uncharacterized protein n=1 Tax=Roseofilum reptotaenium AO1-A TaxID=1925591 RepID=A0A1L9QU74_9CYAN|nr:hypothetical protein [Roseofilum reptotaenium]MDB9517361.1 hypothetical protein [Roseofilum reptotaenium CS-1145]OJJ26214.1 hypothetical protein BI308_07375 [Roseofilum reptotaenium AO1-A]